jgi:hypothetical protein
VKELFLLPKHLRKLFSENHLGEGKFILQNVLNELVVSTVKVVENPCVEELELLNFKLTLLLILANLGEIKFNKILVVEF